MRAAFARGYCGNALTHPQTLCLSAARIEELGSPTRNLCNDCVDLTVRSKVIGDDVEARLGGHFSPERSGDDCVKRKRRCVGLQGGGKGTNERETA